MTLDSNCERTTTRTAFYISQTNKRISEICRWPWVDASRNNTLQLNPTYADGRKNCCCFFLLFVFFFYIPFHFLLLLLATLTVMFAIFSFFFPHCWWCPWARLSWLSPMPPPPPLLLCWMSSAHVSDRRALYNNIIIIILSDKVKVSSYFCLYK